MSQLAEEALRAGACGVSTSRTILHSSKHGLVPGTARRARGAARPRRRHRPGRPRRVPARLRPRRAAPATARWLVDLVDRTGVTATYAAGPGRLRARRRAATRSADAAEDAAAGRRSSRRWPAGPPGCSSACSRRCTRSSPTRPTARSPTCRWPSGSPGCASPRCGPRLARRGAAAPGTRSPAALMQRWDQIFPLGDPPDYEPPPSASVAGRRRARGPAPAGGRARLAARAATARRSCSPRWPATSTTTTRRIREMMTDPTTVLGLSDGGAHCGLICDVSMPTYLLTHWVQRPLPRRAARPRAGDQPADVAHGGGLRLHRPRRARRRASGPTSTSSTSTACTCTRRRWSSTSPPAAAASSSGPTATSPRSWRAGHVRARRAHRRAPRAASSASAVDAGAGLVRRRGRGAAVRVRGVVPRRAGRRRQALGRRARRQPEGGAAAALDGLPRRAGRRDAPAGRLGGASRPRAGSSPAAAPTRPTCSAAPGTTTR